MRKSSSDGLGSFIKPAPTANRFCLGRSNVRFAAAATAEERLGTRQKHCPEFPVNAVRKVLEIAKVELKDITHVAIARDPQKNLLAKARYVAGSPLNSMAAVWEHFGQRRRTSSTLGDLAEICGKPQAHARYELVPV